VIDDDVLVSVERGATPRQGLRGSWSGFGKDHGQRALFTVKGRKPLQASATQDEIAWDHNLLS